MNKASRDKDISSLEFYGPLASALSFIVHSGNKRNTNLQEKFIVYRGIHNIHTKELQSRFKNDSKIRLTGFTSSTLREDIGILFALDGKPEIEQIDSDLHSLLLEIEISGSN